MSLCIAAAGKVVTLAAAAFTLSWTHSVERTRWEEDWRLVPAGFELVEARVRGSGAGMDPGEGAVLADGWWVWKPDLPPQPRIALAASGATAGGWWLCAAEGECVELGAVSGAPVVIEACDGVGKR